MKGPSFAQSWLGFGTGKEVKLSASTCWAQAISPIMFTSHHLILRFGYIHVCIAFLWLWLGIQLWVKVAVHSLWSLQHGLNTLYIDVWGVAALQRRHYMFLCMMNLETKLGNLEEAIGERIQYTWTKVQYSVPFPYMPPASALFEWVCFMWLSDITYCRVWCMSLKVLLAWWSDLQVSISK